MQRPTETVDLTVDITLSLTLYCNRIQGFLRSYMGFLLKPGRGDLDIDRFCQLRCNNPRLPDIHRPHSLRTNAK